MALVKVHKKNKKQLSVEDTTVTIDTVRKNIIDYISEFNSAPLKEYSINNIRELYWEIHRLIKECCLTYEDKNSISEEFLSNDNNYYHSNWDEFDVIYPYTKDTKTISNKPLIVLSKFFDIIINGWIYKTVIYNEIEPDKEIYFASFMGFVFDRLIEENIVSLLLNITSANGLEA